MSIDMSEFYQVFFEEAAELLGDMETLLVDLDVDNPNMEHLNAIFRVAHSIKGGAATFGFTDMTEVTHVLESLLDRLRKQELALRSDMIDAFLLARDVINSQLAGHRGDGEADESGAAAICAVLKALAGGEAGPANVPALPRVKALEQNSTSNPPALAESQDEGEIKTAEDEGFGFFEPLYQALTQPGQPDFPEIANQPIQGATSTKVTPINDVHGLERAAGKASISADGTTGVAPRRASDGANNQVAAHGRRESDKAVTTSADTSIRVNIEKVDQLINLVGELVITQAMLTQTASSLDPVKCELLLQGISQLERNSRDLQESVMSIRMMPISFVFSRFPRLVRDLAGKLDKQVELKTIGEGTELDKGLIEKIADPLTHLVRNSLDHGVESADKRIAAGKPAKGTITLRAFHQGGNVVIEVSDDGAGLNREKILAKARERGLPVHDGMPDSDVWQLIFEAGFSTAEVVTDVSGRGVGMDVVKRNIKALGGSVEIQSSLGVGTSMFIRLPLTLAILDGMSIAVGSEIFIIPLTAIVESLQPAPGDIKTISKDGCVVNVRGEYLPVVALHELFNIRSSVTDYHKGIMVILESEGVKKALLVDELVGQHQVVIKSLETNYRRVPGVSGATIMGDGRVALILDVAGLTRAQAGQLLRAA